MVTPSLRLLWNAPRQLPTGDRARAGGYRAHVQFGRAGFHRQIPKPRLSRGLLTMRTRYRTFVRRVRARRSGRWLRRRRAPRAARRAVRCDDRPRSAVLVYRAHGAAVFAQRARLRLPRALEINRQGVREHYLWVGVATTIDRGFIAPEAQEHARSTSKCGASRSSCR